jgi:hypothetical protein
MGFYKVLMSSVQVYSTDGSAGRRNIFSQILPFCPSSTNMRALSQFLLHIFLLSPLEI